jgi:AcrR family transcriptional regulator
VTSDSATTSNPRRRPKGDKRQRTRAALIQAAIELIGEQGFERTTLAAVAARAGMTTGAIYGNFKNREELFMAVGEIRGAPITPRLWPGMSFADLMRSQAEAVIAALPQRRQAAIGTLSFHAYSLTHEELREQRVEVNGRIYAAGAQFLSMFPREDLPMEPRLLMPVLHALIDGIVLQRLITPELVPDEAIYAAFEAFAAKKP